MKKTLTLALAILAVGSMSAQKQNLDQAKKLVGKMDKIGDARNLIKQASENPETANDPLTYYLGGKIEIGAFDEAFKRQMINPQDPSVKPHDMGEQLINAYKSFSKALPLDSLPNEKGKIKPKYSKDIASILNGHYNDYWNHAGQFYNDGKYYPQAYEAFMIHGRLPRTSFATKELKATPDSVVNTSFFNAGISAWQAKEFEAAAAAFKAARLMGSDKPDVFIYELASWQNFGQNDSTKAAIAKPHIKEVANAGNDKFGIAQPLFLNNLVNTWVIDGENQTAIDKLTQLIANNPNTANLYGLRGYVYDRMNNDDASVADYKKATETEDVDFETLKNAAKKIFRVGTTKWNNIEGATAAQRKELKENYFDYAKKVTDKAKAMKADDSDLDYVIENIDYALETFFTK